VEQGLEGFGGRLPVLQQPLLDEGGILAGQLRERPGGEAPGHVQTKAAGDEFVDQHAFDGGAAVPQGNQGPPTGFGILIRQRQQFRFDEFMQGQGDALPAAGPEAGQGLRHVARLLVGGRQQPVRQARLLRHPFAQKPGRQAPPRFFLFEQKQRPGGIGGGNLPEIGAERGQSPGGYGGFVQRLKQLHKSFHGGA